MNTANKEATCSERIAERLASEEENLKAIYSNIDGTGEVVEYENAYEELYDYAIGSDTRQETILTLSWGGPASYLEITHRGAEIYKVVYRFSDWFDTATQEVEEESNLYRYAQEMINIQEGAI